MNREAKEDEDEYLCEKRLHVRNDDGGVAVSTWNGTRWVVMRGCWTAAPGDGMGMVARIRVYTRVCPD